MEKQMMLPMTENDFHKAWMDAANQGFDPTRNGYFLPEVGPRIISVDRENGIITVDGGLTRTNSKRQVKARAKAKRAKQARKRNRK